jgi:photosystem II stability/assembly factor-like uncharacterized protein
VFSIAPSAVTQGLIWAGTDDGLIQVTRDEGKNWSNVTPKDLPEWSRVSLIEASPFDPGKAYVAIDRHQNDDLGIYIYKTTDYGASWVRLGNGIPEGDFVRAVREDPKRKGLLYAGTERGIYVSFDDGANWRSLKLNLPNTPVHDRSGFSTTSRLVGSLPIRLRATKRICISPQPPIAFTMAKRRASMFSTEQIRPTARSSITTSRRRPKMK